MKWIYMTLKGLLRTIRISLNTFYKGIIMSEKTAFFISTQVTSGEYCYLNMTPENDAEEVVVCGGRELCSTDYRIERRAFSYNAIEFVSAGKGTLRINKNSYELHPGIVFCYGPETPHTIETNPDTPLVKHFIDFTGKELVRLIDTTILGKGIPLYTSRPFRLRNLFENLIEAGNTPSRNRNAQCLLLLKMLILTIDDTAIDTHSAASLAWQTYLRCRQHIEAHFLQIESVEDAASQCNIDKAYLARLFKRFTEESPGKLLVQLKMNKAAELLGNHNMLVKEVAKEVGYIDPYHFSRVFKRVYGIPPETFSHAARRHGLI